MRFDILAFAIVAALIPVTAFVPIQRSVPELRKLAFSLDDDGEDRLDQMIDKWTELKKKEKEIEKAPDDAAAFQLLNEVIKTAIDYTRLQEDIEIDHATSAHSKLEKALELEDSLNAMLDEAHTDAAYADATVNMYNAKGLPEDAGLRLELTVSELSHHIENYAEERLHEARDTELKAKDEEDEAKRSLLQLAEKEELLKATLKELQEFKQQKEMKNM